MGSVTAAPVAGVSPFEELDEHDDTIVTVRFGGPDDPTPRRRSPSPTTVTRDSRFAFPAPLTRHPGASVHPTAPADTSAFVHPAGLAPPAAFPQPTVFVHPTAFEHTAAFERTGEDAAPGPDGEPPPHGRPPPPRLEVELIPLEPDEDP
jgi:hypothetical protein